MDLATTEHTTRQAIEAVDRSFPGKVTGKLKRALDAMIWDGLKRDDAAREAGMSVHGLREALKRPHVKQYYKAALVVLRDNEQARNVHALIEVRDQQTNQMARVQAVKALEQLSDEPTSGAHSQKLPGLVVQINVGPAAPQPIIDVSPTND